MPVNVHRHLGLQMNEFRVSSLVVSQLLVLLKNMPKIRYFNIKAETTTCLMARHLLVLNDILNPRHWWIHRAGKINYSFRKIELKPFLSMHAVDFVDW